MHHKVLRLAVFRNSHAEVKGFYFIGIQILKKTYEGFAFEVPSCLYNNAFSGHFFVKKYLVGIRCNANLLLASGIFCCRLLHRLP